MFAKLLNKGYILFFARIYYPNRAKNELENTNIVIEKEGREEEERKGENGREGGRKEGKKKKRKEKKSQPASHDTKRKCGNSGQGEKKRNLHACVIMQFDP